MPQRSAGIVLFRRTEADIEVLLGHMGGPLWRRKDAAAWSFPKGLLEPGEDDRAAAAREFAEELGVAAPAGEWIALGEAKQSSGKVVALWAVEGDLDVTAIVPGTFEMQWPPRSGRVQAFPEIDRAEWFAVTAAAEKLVAGQRAFLDRLVSALG